MIFKTINKFRRIRNYILSSLLRFDFASVGKNFRIDLPISIIGSRNITIGRNFCSSSRLRIETFENHNEFKYKPYLSIGDDVSINTDCHIGCVNKISIGNNVLIASRVFITDHYHGSISADDLLLPPSKRKVISKGPVIIEDNVWIGEGVAIMPNVTIGKNSIVGANSVVTKSFPANCVIAGNPARIIREIK